MGDTIPHDRQTPANPDAKSLIAYAVGEESLQLIVAPSGRAWMDKTNQHFANRCLPLLMANQSGWFLITKRDIEIIWNGGPGKESLRVTDLSSQPGHCPAVSIFGHGILTWHIPYLFRTPPGYNLLVRGPSNWPKENIFPLEGLVETDWAVATFTMNYQIMRPNTLIRFSAGDPICMIVPQRRGELEQFNPVIQSIDTAPGERDGYKRWAASRTEFNQSLAAGVRHPPNQAWQKHYLRGSAPDGRSTDSHETKRTLLAFESPTQNSSHEAPKLLTHTSRPPSTKLSYMICTSPRSGSSLLAEALQSTGVAGRPAEFFDPHAGIEMGSRRRFGAELDTCHDYIQKLLHKTTTENGVFGIKSHWHQFIHLCRQLQPPSGQPELNLALLSEHFPNPRYIWLRRKDKVRQAVSYARAAQTNVWWKIEGAPSTPEPPVQLNLPMIAQSVHDLEKHDAGWEDLFARSNVQPHIIWYEQFIDDYQNTIMTTLQYLDIPFPENFTLPTPRLRKQSDLMTEEWVRRYLDSQA